MSYMQTYISDRQACERYNINRVTLWRWARTGTFPRPVKLSKGCTRWRLSDVEAWEEKKAAEKA